MPIRNTFWMSHWCGRALKLIWKSCPVVVRQPPDPNRSLVFII